MYIYSRFHENCSFDVHYFSPHYLSILLKAGSWGNRFHETFCIYIYMYIGACLCLTVLSGVPGKVNSRVPVIWVIGPRNPDHTPNKSFNSSCYFISPHITFTSRSSEITTPPPKSVPPIISPQNYVSGPFRPPKVIKKKILCNLSGVNIQLNKLFPLKILKYM